MKINKHIFICALLVLMMMGVIGTVSATDSLNNDNLTADEAVGVDMGDSIYSSPSTTNELLGDGETTIYVDSSYDGDEQGTAEMPYKTISSAVGAATTGGETIFIKNGEYIQDTKFSFTKSINFVGESRDGVIIKSTATNGVFETVENGVALSFKNLNFIDIAAGSTGTLNVGGDSNLDVINCTFANCGSKYGVMWIKTPGTVNIEDVNILNSEGTATRGGTAIYFQGAGNYNVKNTLIDNAQYTGSSGFSYAPIYTVNQGSSLTVDNVKIYNCGGNTYAMIYTNGIATVKNSRIINNTVPGATGNTLIYAARNTLTIEQTVIVNNSATNYLVFCNTGGTAVLNYNYIANNTITTSGNVLPVYGAGTSGTNTINADSNYWGSNDPTITGTTVNNYVIVNDAGDYVLNDGSPLPEGKTIPSVDEPGDEPVGDENSTFVSVDGDDSNTGSEDSPVATIAKAVELAKNRTGEIIINEGTYTESGIEIDSDIPISIMGNGNVVIDGNADTTSIFILSNNPSVSFTNIKFRNSRAQNGGAINARGSSNSNTIVINVTVDHCAFEDMAVTKQGGGGAIYLKYASGYLQVTDSSFTNLNASGTWAGAISVGYSIRGDGGLYVLINGSTFEDCSANNGGACYLQARTVDVMNSIFRNNHATADSGAIYIYNSTARIDNCEFSNNDADRYAAAIQVSSPTGYTHEMTITNSIIENNVGTSSTLPAIYVDKVNLDISYSSIVNDLSVGTSSATAAVNNNWWGTNDPSSKTTGSGITMDNWVIMNVVANATEAIPGDKIALTVDFNHVNTTAGEIEELTGGAIPKAYKVQLSSNDGTIVPSTLTVKDGATKTAVYTVADLYDTVKVSSDEALVEMTFVPEVPPYYGIIYVSKDGNDDNNGSEDAPVATITKAIELATRVGGSHQIVINEGTYQPGESLTITDDLTITGNGAVVIDADGIEKLIDLPYSSPVKGFTVVLNNLALINGVGNQYATVYNYADAYLFLNNVNISDCTGSYLGAIVTTTGNTTITDSVISDSTAGRIINVNVGYNKPITVTIINTTLKDNVAFIDDGSDIGQGYATIDVSSTTKGTVLNLIDSHITGNTGKLGTVYTTSDKVTMNVNGTEFIDNTVLTGNGGAINGYTMTVNNSTFINNRAAKDNVYGVATGGAINIGRLGNAVITNSKFVDNSATGNGNTIYNGWNLTINYCAIIDNTKGNVIYHNGEDNVMDAKYNWWGTNDDPSSLIGVGQYEDDYGYGNEPCEFDVSRWVVMAVSNNYTGEPVAIGDQIEFTVNFKHDNQGSLLFDSIPEVEVSADAVKGAFDKEKTTTENSVATFVYTADVGGEDTIDIASSEAVDTTLIDIIEPVIIEVIYVGPNGNDSNPGYYDSPVATIAHAIEIAERGKIVIFEGNYTIDSTLAINKDLNIRGEGAVIIDGNLNRIIENTANLNLTNLIFTNAKLGFGSAILSDGNVTIDGCTFYNNTATATTSGNIINNRKGTMTINNSKFYDNVASRGAVASQSGTNLTVNNSAFYDNDMSLSGSSSYYGIIYSTSADTIVENTVFRNNKAKQGAGVWATRSTYGTTGSLEVINCTFENNIAEIGTGGAVFTSGKIEANIKNSTFINNTATRSENGVGGNGGAIYTTGTSSVTVVDSVFIDNAGYEDAGIYASGDSFTIRNSVLLAKYKDANPALKVNGATVTAENNFWGDNSKANTDANVEKWVIMTADYNQDSGLLNISFDKTNSTDGTVADYGDVLPDGFTVSVSSSSGKLDETLPVISGQASTTYTTKESEDIIVQSGNAEVVISVVVIPHIIYVAVDGNDANNGSIDNPVATIAKAIELADEGKIVILEGRYTTGDLGIISDDLNITGYGTVTIDAQKNNRILYVGEDAAVVLKNLIMINGKSEGESGALLGNSNELTLINCTLSDSSAGINNGGAIYNVGKLTIINSTFANNVAEVGGAIYNDLAELTIINSTFENNIANGDSDNHGGGAIFAQRMTGLSIDNSTFVGNDVSGESSGGAIFISFANAEYTIANSRFISNHAEGKANTGGGAIYMVGTSNNERKGKLSISNTLFEENTADTCGAAIYARATTVDVSNSVIFANKDPSGFAVYGYKTDMVSPAITLNDNWWGTNDDPKDFVGGNNNYKPTIARWAILTANNDTPFVEGNTVKITAELNKYTDGETIGTLATPITIPRDVVIETTFDSIEGVMKNGEFTIDYLVPANLKLLALNVDIENIELLRVRTETVVEIDDITALKGDTVNVTATVKDKDGSSVFVGEVEVYFDGDLVATIPVIEGSAIKEVSIDKDAGVYDIFALYVDSTGDFKSSNASAVLNVIKKDAYLNISEIAVDEFNNVVVTVEIDDGVEGNVTISVEGDKVIYSEDVAVEKGIAVYTVPDALLEGKYTVSATFEGNDYYYDDNVEEVISISKVVTSVEVADITAVKGDAVNVNVSVKTASGADVNAGEVAVYFGDDLVATIQVINGTAVQEVTIDKNAGVYDILAVYTDESGLFNASEDSAVLNVIKKDAYLNISDIAVDEFNNVVVTVEIDDGVEGNVTISVEGNNVTYSEDVPVKDGTAVYAVPDALLEGKYTVSVTFEGNDYYYEDNAEEVISISKIVTSVEVADITAVKGDTVNISVSVKTASGVDVNAGEVAVYFGDDLVATIPVINGTAVQEVTIDKNAGVYDISAVYTDESGVFDTDKDSAVLNVIKKDAYLNISDIAVDEFNNVVITVEVDDGVEGNLNFLVEGDNVIYSDDVPVKDGTAVYRISEALGEGNYSILVTFEGNDYYYEDNAEEMIAMSIIITSVEVADITAVKGDTVNISVSVKTASGADVDVGEVAVYFGDDLVATIPVVDGAAVQEVTIDKDAGVYDISAIYIGESGLFNASEGSAVLNVIKKDAYLNISDIAVDEFNNVVVTVEIDDGIEGNVTISVEGNNVTYSDNVPVKDGTAVYRISEALGEGKYSILVVFEGNDYYYADGDSQIITITKIATDLVADVTVIDSSNKYVVATLKDGNGNAIDQAEVMMEIDGNYYYNVTDADGQVKFYCGDLDAGNYDAVISYAGNEVYNSSNIDASINVKADTALSAEDVSVYYGDANGKVIATLTNAEGRPLSANIVININGVNYSLKTNSKGQASVSTADLNPGNYTATIAYKGNSKYNPSSTTAKVNIMDKLTSVVSADDVSIYDGDANGKFVATLTNAEGTPLRANVVVTIDGVDYAMKSDANGQVNVSIADLSPGTYVATVVYKGNSKYYGSNTTAKIVVKEKFVSVVSADDVSVKLGNPDGKFVATLTNESGNPLSANVIVTLNGVTYAQKSNAKGQVIISTADLPVGEYVATVVYKGNSRYYASNTTAKVVVDDKFVSVVSAADVIVSKDDTDGKFIATLTNESGKPLSANVYVTINGVTYAQKSNAKGQVIISLDDLEIGEYTATVVYKGNSRYDPSSTTAKIVVNNKLKSVVSANDVTVKCGDANGKFIATLTNANGVPLSANVVVTINGVTYAQKSNSKGQVIISTADLDEGEYTATVVYKGNSRYNPSTTTAKVVVNNKLTSVVSADDVTVKCGDENSRFIATLTNSEGVPLSANVVVNLNGVDYAMKSDSKGRVSVSTADLDIGEYTATVTYKGNSKYNPSTTTAKVVVNNKLTSCISGAYNAKTKEVVGKLTNSAGVALSANVVVSLNGVDHALKSDSKGQFKVSAADLGPGSYTAKLVYKGNSKYNPSSTTVNVVIA